MLKPWCSGSRVALPPVQVPSLHRNSISSRASEELQPNGRSRCQQRQLRLKTKAYNGKGDKGEEQRRAPAQEVAVEAAPVSASLAAGSVDKEIFSIALPTLATLAADPIAGLVSTAFVGRMGPPEQAAVGVALSVYNTLTKLFNMPLISITTSTVASALGKGKDENSERVSTAVSAAILLSLLTGAAEAALLALCGVRGLQLWGAGPSSSMHRNAVDYLTVRALATPAAVLLSTLQGIFRGLGDTRAPFFATLLCNAVNIALEPLLIFTLGWGVAGAAGAIALAQGLSCCVLLFMLRQRCKLRLAGSQALRESLQYLKPTGLLTLRTLCISAAFAVATSLAARTGAVHMAAHQVCFQVWLASSLLADSLAVASQALLARTLAAGDRQTGKVVASRTLQLALWLGLSLAVALGCSASVFPRLFSQDAAVLRTMALILPAVVATQPINAMAFLMDGVLYGVGGFRYAAQAMLVAVSPALLIMLLGSRLVSRQGWGPNAQLLLVWVALGSVMLMRFLTIYMPYRLRQGPFQRLEAV